MKDLPPIVYLAPANDFEAACRGQAKRKAVERLFRVREFLMPAIVADCVATSVLPNPNAKSARTLCGNLQASWHRGVSHMRILLQFLFNLWNHHLRTQFESDERVKSRPASA